MSRFFHLLYTFFSANSLQNGNYADGVSFEDIVGLYLLNSSLRQVLLTQIEKVEIILRCRLTNYFCTEYGILGYEVAENFQSEEFHSELIENIDQEIERNSKSPFVKNFRDNYIDGKIPFYALIELFSLGTLSKYYKNMKNKDKKGVALLFGIGYTYFES